MKLKGSLSSVLVLAVVILSVPAVNYGWEFLSAEAENEDGEKCIDWRTLSDYSCSASVKIPRSVTNIGIAAFSGCIYMTSVEIPDSVTNIGIEAFSGCISLTCAEIPDSVTDIGDSAFSDCRSLTRVKIPQGVTKIGNGVFSGCGSLTSAEIPPGVTSIGYKAFSDCVSLTSAEIPDSVTDIGRWAFSGCDSLTSVKISRNVTHLNDGVFYGCGSLTSVKIPDSVTSISDGVFYGCDSLTSVEIPDSVTSIGRHTFNNCPKLTIYGMAGSYAESYANENSISFKPISSLCFDDAESGVKAEILFTPEAFLSVEVLNDAVDNDIITYNITFKDFKGNIVQPYEAIIVKIPVPKGQNGELCRVYRQEENGAYTDMNAAYSDGCMVFKTDNFGNYILSMKALTDDGGKSHPAITTFSEAETEISAEPEENPETTTVSETENEISAQPEENHTTTAVSETEPEIPTRPEENPSATAETETEPVTAPKPDNGISVGENSKPAESAASEAVSETDKSSDSRSDNEETPNKTENSGSSATETVLSDSSEADFRLPNKNNNISGINQSGINKSTGLAISTAPVIITSIIAAIASKKKK